MNSQKRSNRGTTNGKNNEVRWEQTPEGQKLLNSINAAFHHVRMENEYIGETRILQNLSKKTKSKHYTSSVDKDLEKLIINSKSTSNKESNNIFIPQNNRREGYIRTTPPKN